MSGVSRCWPLIISEDILLPGQEGAVHCIKEGWRFHLLTSGVAYWLGQPDNRELAVSELLVVGPLVSGALRASQINEARFRRFYFNPAAVVGLFSLAERVELSRRLPGTAHVLPASHPAALLVARAPLPESAEARLISRATLLHAALLVLAEGLPHANEHLCSGAAARHFHRLFTEAPDARLLAHPPEEIAALCHCTQRHLNTLWRQELACNIRDSQVEIRLRLARELIESGEGRISDIARRVGYSDTSRFNAAFKKLFGRTPTECRALVSEL